MQVTLAALLVGLLASQLCLTTVVVADQEQAARDFLENLYRVAEPLYFKWISASWNFNVNITVENNQRVVGNETRRLNNKLEVIRDLKLPQKAVLSAGECNRLKHIWCITTFLDPDPDQNVVH